jgi:F0F1-type ATP synthase membrane subunit c/vacuolar-type H+-ATPase subunit K
MSDIPDLQLFAIGLMVFGCYFTGYYFGKISGRQQAEARHRTQMKALRAARQRNNPRR